LVCESGNTMISATAPIRKSSMIAAARMSDSVM
jgi:hypothetical protein